MTDAPMIAVEGLTKRFRGMDRPALDGITAAIPEGGMTGLAGPDGAGKTTLIRLLAGLMRPDEGRATVDGRDAARETEAIHRIAGYMPQRFGLYEDLSVDENLRLHADLRGLAGEARAESFDRLLRFTGLGPFRRRLAGQLSGGMKQKLGLACALIGRPRVLLLDEPSVGVDPISRRELWSMVRELVEDGVTAVWSTAYLDEAERCDRVILLDAGRLLHDGPPGDLLERVEGRSFRVSGVPAERKRPTLMALMRRDEVADATIRGADLHVLLAPDADRPEDAPGDWSAESPRFEDAYVDALGRKAAGRSALAEGMAPRPEDGGPAIEAEGLTRRFGDFTAVRNVGFSVRRGEIFGLLGPNGAGKSTIFRMMCGLLPPSAGRAHVTGLDLGAAPAKARARIGYMAQKFALYGDLSVRQNLAFFARLYGLSGRSGRRRIDLTSEVLGLGPYLGAVARETPVGFQRRLSLACAVMHEPDVLFLDEPTSGVDPVTRREIWTHVDAMTEKGVAVMVTTHFMDEAEYCDRLALVHRGEIVAEGAPDALRREAGEEAAETLEDAFVALISRAEEGEARNGGAAA